MSSVRPWQNRTWRGRRDPSNPLVLVGFRCQPSAPFVQTPEGCADGYGESVGFLPAAFCPRQGNGGKGEVYFPVSGPQFGSSVPEIPPPDPAKLPSFHLCVISANSLRNRGFCTLVFPSKAATFRFATRFRESIADIVSDSEDYRLICGKQISGKRIPGKWLHCL